MAGLFIGLLLSAQGGWSAETSVLFQGPFTEEFGYTVGVKSQAGIQTPGEVVQGLGAQFKPFRQLTIGVSHPSATVYSLRATGSLRSAGACTSAAAALRDRLQTAYGLALREEAFQRYKGYFGVRDGVVRRISCDGEMLATSIELQGHEHGCDRADIPSVPQDALASALAALKMRFPDAEAWSGAEVNRALSVIGMRADDAYASSRRHLPCLQGRLAFSAAIDPAGKVLAVEVAASEGFDEALRQRVAGILLDAAFPMRAEVSTRLVSVTLLFSRRD